MTFDELREKAHALPLVPGVYIMMDKSGEVIYVGKAKALKNRVSQYFQSSAAHTEKTRAMVSRINRFDVIVAETEFEALVLECALIKRHQPHYNILLKDDKAYPYIRLTVKEPYPSFSLTAKVADDGARYFGPYGGRGTSWAIIDALRMALKLPSCNKKFPRDIGKERPCLNYHMGRCEGWCRPEADAGKHGEAIAQAIRLLEGRFGEVEVELKARMEQASEELRFEEAAALRDRLRAIELLGKRQKVLSASLADTDVIGFHVGEANSCFVVLHYTGGELASKDMELFETPVEESEEETLSSLLTQYYNGRSGQFREILLPRELEDIALIERMLSEQAGRRVYLITPKRGAKADLIRLANTNAVEEAERATTAEQKRSKLLSSLAALAGLQSPPRRIEAFDISNTGASDIVASMTVFADGKPRKRDYRHFKLKDMEGPDDYAAMAQVITRRLLHGEGDEKFGSLPDLILVDGGEQHAAAAVNAMAEIGFTIPTVGMVKDERHRTRALVTHRGELLGLQNNPALFAFIGQIQEETHRFAIEFHRLQRSKHVKGSALDAVPGVGEARRKALLRRFGSVKNIKKAALSELEEAVPHNVALAVREYFGEEQVCESSPEQPGEEN